jgi:hypothetical protein
VGQRQRGDVLDEVGRAVEGRKRSMVVVVVAARNIFYEKKKKVLTV